MVFLRVFILVAFSWITSVASAKAEELRVGGTGAATQVLHQAASAFTKKHEASIKVVASLGSSGAIRALSDGVLDIAVSGRPLKADEESKGLKVALIARTPFVIATAHPKPGSMSASSLPAMFSPTAPSWSDGTPVKIILRPRSESDTHLLGELFPGLAAAIETARRRPDVPVAATDQDNADMAEKIPGSLVGSTLVQIVTEKRELHPVAIDGIAPTLEHFESGVYRYGKPIYFVLGTTPSPVAERFLAFLRSPEGIALLRSAAVIL